MKKASTYFYQTKFSVDRPHSLQSGDSAMNMKNSRGDLFNPDCILPI